ncbi:MAG: prepilin-type N-terminal cleavage/methylation domain-containing protein [Deltaproteobacteria bacterium]|nr:prepilin-type N-terminal cleavage/methylation domain-containing protein [Deltaproteobacteria bacterium]
MTSASETTINTKFGFSLYEVIVVMVIIAIVSAISILNYNAWIPKIRLNGAAHQVMSDLVAARMSSVKENVSVVVRYLNNHSYSVTVGSKPASIKDLQPDYPGTVLSFTSVLFSSRGTTSPRTLTLQNSSGIKKITIAITGRVKIN